MKRIGRIAWWVGAIAWSLVLVALLLPLLPVLAIDGIWYRYRLRTRGY